jgi:hypothetical protein
MGKSVSKKAARAAFAASIARNAPTTFSTKRRLEVLRVDAKADARVERTERKAAKPKKAKLTIVSWAHEQGLQTFGNDATREATAAAIERRRLVFEEVTLGMVRLEQEMLALASSTHNVFVGQAGTTAYVAEQWEPHHSTTHAPAAPFPTARGGWQMRAGLRSSWGILDGLEAAGEAQPQNGPGR